MWRVGWLLLLLVTSAAAQPRVLTPAGAAKPVGPYSPALAAGTYVYVSGQGVRDDAGAMPAGIEAQTRQCLSNVRANLAAGGLEFRHVAASQLYLSDMADLPVVERLWSEAFGTAAPPRVTLGAAHLPTGTTIEITVVARRTPDERVYLDAVYGRTRREAERKLSAALKAAGLRRKQVTMANWYTTGVSRAGAVGVAALPDGARWAVSAIASKEMETGTVFCEVVSARSAGTVEEQTISALLRLETCLARRGATLAGVVSTNVYLDDIANFAKMNGAYATMFTGLFPTRTTIQPAAPAQAVGMAVRVSGIAVKP